MFSLSTGKEEHWYKVSIYLAIPFILLCLILLIGFISVTTFKIVWSSLMIVNIAFMYVKNTFTNHTSDLNDE